MEARDASVIKYKETLADLIQFRNKLKRTIDSGTLKWKLDILRKNIDLIQKKSVNMDHVNEQQAELDALKSDIKQLEEKYRQEIASLKTKIRQDERTMRLDSKRVEDEETLYWKKRFFEVHLNVEKVHEEYQDWKSKQQNLDEVACEMIEKTKKEYRALRQNELEQLKLEKSRIAGEWRDTEKLIKTKKEREKNLTKRKEELTLMIASLKSSISEATSYQRIDYDSNGEERRGCEGEQ